MYYTPSRIALWFLSHPRLPVPLTDVHSSRLNCIHSLEMLLIGGQFSRLPRSSL